MSILRDGQKIFDAGINLNMAATAGEYEFHPAALPTTPCCEVAELDLANVLPSQVGTAQARHGNSSFVDCDHRNVTYPSAPA